MMPPTEPGGEQSHSDPKWGQHTTDENKIVLTLSKFITLIVSVIGSAIGLFAGYYDLKTSNTQLKEEVAMIRRDIQSQNGSLWSVSEMREYGSQLRDMNGDAAKPLKVPSVYEVRTALGK